MNDVLALIKLELRLLVKQTSLYGVNNPFDLRWSLTIRALFFLLTEKPMQDYNFPRGYPNYRFLKETDRSFSWDFSDMSRFCNLLYSKRPPQVDGLNPARVPL